MRSSPRTRCALGGLGFLLALVVVFPAGPAWAAPAWMAPVVPAAHTPVQVVPPPVDTIPLDTIPLDTIPGDTIGADTTEAPRTARNLPEFHDPVPTGWRTGVWEWDRAGLLTTSALSLLELLELIPGVTALRGGDFGQPATVTAFGLGPGRVRVYLNGAELAPLDGGVVDLAQVGLGGLDRVRVERRTGELRVELRGLRLTDPRVYSLLEVGTGDLGTNIFRATFAHPDAFGGNAVLALDRIDTEGPGRDELGVSSGAHFRYDYFLRDRTALSAELHRTTARRPEAIWAPAQVNRTDWSVRGRHQVTDRIVAELFYHSASLSLDEERSGPGADTLVSTDARREFGARVGMEGSWWWSRADLRRRTGEGWPTDRASLTAGLTREGLGGLSTGIDWEGWEDDSAFGYYLRAWTEPRFGIALFGELEDGRRGVPVRVPIPPEEPDDEDPNGDPPTNGNGLPEEEEEPFVPSFSDRQGLRAGAEFRYGGLSLGGAVLVVRADSLFPSGIGRERAGVTVGGTERTGLEVFMTIPLDRLLEGLAFVGSAQRWNEDDAWRSLPNESYDARLRFHNIFFPSRNLEVWSDLGVRGREEMTVPLAAPAGAGLREVPFLQSWYVRLQVRVLDVHAFVQWDNFTLRERNQDYPNRILPATRTMYGVRWTLWN